MDPGDPFPDERCRTAREDGGVTVERVVGPVRADHRERRLYLRQQAGQFGAVTQITRVIIEAKDRNEVKAQAVDVPSGDVLLSGDTSSL